MIELFATAAGHLGGVDDGVSRGIVEAPAGAGAAELVEVVKPTADVARIQEAEAARTVHHLVGRHHHEVLVDVLIFVAVEMKRKKRGRKRKKEKERIKLCKIKRKKINTCQLK
jgi:hypothetical protein